jgi:hypothetical protein
LYWTKIKSRVEAHGLVGEGLMESLLALSESHYLEVNVYGTDVVLAYTITTFGYTAGIDAVVPDLDTAKQQVKAALVNDPPTGDRVIHDFGERTGIFCSSPAPTAHPKPQATSAFSWATIC